MVLGERLPWKNVFKLHAPVLALTALVAAAATALDRQMGVKLLASPAPFVIAGVALVVFLSFRNRAAYDRWWEGRKLWGGIVHESRSLGRQMLAFLDPGTLEVQVFQREIVYRHIGYLNALRCQLRGQDPRSELTNLVGKEEIEALGLEKNVAARLLHTNGVRLATALRRGWISEERFARLDATLSELSAQQGGCERIRSTPIPTAYRSLPLNFTRLYCVVLPIGLVDPVGYPAIVAAVALSFLFLMLETIGRFLEDPFTAGPNGLPLSSICRTTEINLRQQLDERELPPPVEPTLVAGVPTLP